MIDKWLTVNEIAELLSCSRGWIIQIAKQDDWPYRTYSVRDGKERRYHSLFPHAQTHLFSQDGVF